MNSFNYYQKFNYIIACIILLCSHGYIAELKVLEQEVSVGGSGH